MSESRTEGIDIEKIRVEDELSSRGKVDRRELPMATTGLRGKSQPPHRWSGS